MNPLDHFIKRPHNIRKDNHSKNDTNWYYGNDDPAKWGIWLNRSPQSRPPILGSSTPPINPIINPIQTIIGESTHKFAYPSHVNPSSGGIKPIYAPTPIQHNTQNTQNTQEEHKFAVQSKPVTQGKVAYSK